MKTYAEQRQEIIRSPILEIDGPNDCCNVAREAIIKKVINETLPAMDKFQRNPSRENLIELTVGIVDSVAVLLDAANSFDIPFDAVWNEVIRCNTPKTGKVVKPDVFGVVLEYQTKVAMGEEYMRTGMVK